MKNTKSLLLDLNLDDDQLVFSSSITTALSDANMELEQLNTVLKETYETINHLTPQCDKIDYALAASSGALCGIIDIFLIGKPGESIVGNITDTWFENRTMDFAKLCCPTKNNSTLASSIKNLEQKFKIPYDQHGAGDAASEIFSLNPRNHHFKSLAHSPSLLGLFFSILDQFNNTSHFVSAGQLISLHEADSKFELRGANVPSKLFCAIVNWFGHLLSDNSGSSGSKGRGMGIPSPLWTWTNDVIAIKNSLTLPVTNFDTTANDLAVKIFNQGYDVRFQTAQIIPVFVNEMIVRFIYSCRRLIQYCIKTPKEDYSLKQIYKTIEPFKNATVKRMLTVAHGTCFVVDMVDATTHGTVASSGLESIMRLNVVGLGRFTISLYGESKRFIKASNTINKVSYYEKQKILLDDYIQGLNTLATIYNDEYLFTLIDAFINNKMYIELFQSSVTLAQMRNVSNSSILTNKEDIDNYFRGGKSNV